MTKGVLRVLLALTLLSVVLSRETRTSLRLEVSDTTALSSRVVHPQFINYVASDANAAATTGLADINAQQVRSILAQGSSKQQDVGKKFSYPSQWKVVDKKVAIVGAGPAGLATAAELIVTGVVSPANIHIYERETQFWYNHVVTVDRGEQLLNVLHRLGLAIFPDEDLKAMQFYLNGGKYYAPLFRIQRYLLAMLYVMNMPVDNMHFGVTVTNTDPPGENAVRVFLNPENNAAMFTGQDDAFDYLVNAAGTHTVRTAFNQHSFFFPLPSNGPQAKLQAYAPPASDYTLPTENVPVLVLGLILTYKPNLPVDGCAKYLKMSEFLRKEWRDVLYERKATDEDIRKAVGRCHVEFKQIPVQHYFKLYALMNYAQAPNYAHSQPPLKDGIVAEWNGEADNIFFTKSPSADSNDERLGSEDIEGVRLYMKNARAVYYRNSGSTAEPEDMPLDASAYLKLAHRFTPPDPDVENVKAPVVFLVGDSLRDANPDMGVGAQSAGYMAIKLVSAIEGANQQQAETGAARIYMNLAGLQLSEQIKEFATTCGHSGQQIHDKIYGLLAAQLRVLPYNDIGTFLRAPVQRPSDLAPAENYLMVPFGLEQSPQEWEIRARFFLSPHVLTELGLTNPLTKAGIETLIKKRQQRLQNFDILFDAAEKRVIALDKQKLEPKADKTKIEGQLETIRERKASWGGVPVKANIARENTAWEQWLAAH